MQLLKRRAGVAQEIVLKLFTFMIAEHAAVSLKIKKFLRLENRDQA